MLNTAQTQSFFSKNLWLFITIAIVIVIAVIILIILLNKKKTPKKVPVNTEILNNIYIALGSNNIESVDREQDRIRLVLKDPKLVDAKNLSDLKIPAFLKGKEVKLLYRNYSDELYLFIKERLEE